MGERFINGSGASRGEVANVCLGVIATRWLAMTVYFGFSKIEYKHATLSVVIAREGACEGY
jgi:hypothetical protein